MIHANEINYTSFFIDLQDGRTNLNDFITTLYPSTVNCPLSSYFQWGGKVRVQMLKARETALLGILTRLAG
jgi:hypothetical protein